MKKNELMTGDIVVTRSGYVAVVIGQGADAYLLFQKHGFEFLDDYYDDDLVNIEDDDAIMQVFRPDGGYGFEGVDQEWPLYERDENWVRPTEEEMAKRAAEARAEYEAIEAKWREEAEKNKANLIAIISQAYYGNRTGTEIRPEHLDAFVLGNLDWKLMDCDRVDRTIIPLPGSDQVVLIYNRYAEEESLDLKRRAWEEDNYVLKPTATIPERNLEIYSRCVVCRMSPDGELGSLQEGDFAIWDKYLAH